MHRDQELKKILKHSTCSDMVAKEPEQAKSQQCSIGVVMEPELLVPSPKNISDKPFFVLINDLCLIRRNRRR